MGPVLFMRNGERQIIISPEGIYQSPDKAGAAESAPAPAEAGVPWSPELPYAEGGEPPPIEWEPPRGPEPARSSVPDVNFVAEHPEDPTLQIHYNVIEGPEVGVYARGTAKLSGGRAVVSLPDHFAHVTSEKGLTVHLTPRSADSKGVAASRLSLRELEIVELFGGTGAYDVDYIVHGVRRGAEGFEVVRPKRPVVMRGAMQPCRAAGEEEVEVGEAE